MKLTSRVVLMALVLMAGLLPVVPASAAPTVNLLNPSGYSGEPFRISTKQDANGDTAYHLVAWAGQVPTNPLVEFEVGATPGIPGQPDPGTTLATVTANRVGTDTFEGFVSTATIPDGQYFLRAILYSGFTGPGTGEEVARDEEPVTIQGTQATAPNTAEMQYPTNGGQFGFSRSGDRAPAGVIAGVVSPGTRQVRALYTTTAPGNEPEWKQCGSASVASDNSFRVRCTLGEGVGSSSVKAVAAVANQTPPPAGAQQSADETGDAHRVTTYLQDPARVSLEPASSTADQGKCAQMIATVSDQFGVAIAGMNIDVHATGPDDQLRFATKQVNAINQHSAFQAPDAAHSGNEGTAKCEPTDPEGRQGDHNVPGAADVKHIESIPTGGTNNQGQFTYFLLSGTKGGTQITAWADENDDDNVNTGEATGSGQLGFGEPPPPAATLLTLDPSSLTATVGDCERFTLTTTQNGTAQAGKNVDIHITNPNDVSFCNPGDANTTAPDAGGHAGDIDPSQENTRHNEGTTNSSGQVIFGVTSPNPGETSVSAWVDDNNSDTQDSTESVAAGTIEWEAEGARGITLRSNRGSVERGRKVKLSGRIFGSDQCASNQVVKIQARKDGRFRTIKRVTTDTQHEYATRVRVKKTTRYRAVAPPNGPCDKARSNLVRVRAK